MYVPSDKVFNDTEHYDSMQEWGMDVQAIDINGAFVPTSKTAKDNLKNAQELLEHRV